MAAFHYQVQDPSGKTLHGVIEADSARMARSQLRDSGLFVLEVQAIEQAGAAAAGGMARLFERNKVSLADLSLMIRQLATLLEAGLALEQALAVLIEQSDDPKVRQVVAGLRSEILAGHTLARAMEQHRNTFPEIHRALICAGEESGELAEVMSRLATYTENQRALQQQVGLAFVYPAIVTVVALLVVGGLLFFVVPQVVSVFQQAHQTLPLLTRSLIWVTDALAAGWLYLLGGMLAAGYMFRQSMQQERFRFSFHSRLLRMPVLGRLIRGMNTARMASTLSILVGSGVSLLTALTAATGVVSNLPMRNALEDAAKKVREGVSLSRALASSSLFPPVLIHLIASGESSGKLDIMLDRVARQQEQEVSGYTTALTSLLEPLLILFMGAVVLVIVLAILLPIIQMNQLIK
ncbi:MAG TPA: type II secretion system inner membrane protein GspF [Sideroxyarcus sp.]|nr:type II secretion system inner membrane protein GspF [Sideroxyarcus sp.]